MPTRVGFGAFAALREEQISEKISRRILSGEQGMIVWWSIRAGVRCVRAEAARVLICLLVNEPGSLNPFEAIFPTRAPVLGSR